MSEWANQQRQAVQLNNRHVDSVFAASRASGSTMAGVNRLADLDEAWDLDDLF
jgi:hypothetical protein